MLIIIIIIILSLYTFMNIVKLYYNNSSNIWNTYTVVVDSSRRQNFWKPSEFSINFI